jgi:hypothetical protein
MTLAATIAPSLLAVAGVTGVEVKGMAVSPEMLARVRERLTKRKSR